MDIEIPLAFALIFLAVMLGIEAVLLFGLFAVGA